MFFLVFNSSGLTKEKIPSQSLKRYLEQNRNIFALQSDKLTPSRPEKNESAWLLIHCECHAIHNHETKTNVTRILVHCKKPTQ